jgi:capsular exopolysaccharide synthesis family protein
MSVEMNGSPAKNLPVPAGNVAGPPAVFADSGPGMHPVGPVSPPVKPLSPFPDAKEFLRAFTRRWLVAITLGFVLAAGVGVALWFGLPPATPNTTAQIHLAAEIPVVGPGSPQREARFDMYKATQVALIRSRLVLYATMRNPEVTALPVLMSKPDPVEWLETKLAILFKDSPEIMQVSLPGEPAEEMVVVINALIKAYFDEVVLKDQNRKRERYIQLKDIAKRFEDKLKSIRQSIRTLQEQVGPVDPKLGELHQQIAQLELAQVQRDLTKLRTELRTLRLQYTSLSKGAAPPAVVAPTKSIGDAIKNDLMIKQYQQKLAVLQNTLDETKRRAVKGEDDPEYQRIYDVYRATKKQLEKRRRELLIDDSPALKAEQEALAKLSHEERLKTMKQRVQFLTALEKLQEKDAERLSKEAKKEKIQILDAIDFQREIEDKEGMVKELRKRATALEIELEAPSRVSLIQTPVVRRPDEQARKMKVAGGAAFAAFALGILFVCFLEHRTRRVGSAVEVLQTTGLSVVGTLPAYRMARRRSGSLAERRIVESVDMARTMLLHARRTESLKAVLIVSAVPGEGKTSLAGHLATSLARAGLRTILVDGDLRKPDLYQVLGRQSGPGVCEIFRGEASIEQSIQETGIDNLSFLAAGEWDDAALRVLDMGGSGPLLDALRAKFDFILIDSSPVLALRDAVLISRNTDGVLFSILARVSKIHLVRAACEKLANVGANILGAMMSGASEEDSSGYGGYYSDYYSENPRATDPASATNGEAPSASSP